MKCLQTREKPFSHKSLLGVFFSKRKKGAEEEPYVAKRENKIWIYILLATLLLNGLELTWNIIANIIGYGQKKHFDGSHKKGNVRLLKSIEKPSLLFKGEEKCLKSIFVAYRTMALD